MNAPLSPLSERDQRILQMRNEEGLSPRVIAERVGLSRTRVDMILIEGPRKLKQYEAHPMGGLGALDCGVCSSLWNVGFRSLDEVKRSVELGHLAWDESKVRVCWKGRPLPYVKWAKWIVFCQRLGFPTPERPAGEMIRCPHCKQHFVVQAKAGERGAD